MHRRVRARPAHPRAVRRCGTRAMGLLPREAGARQDHRGRVDRQRCDERCRECPLGCLLGCRHSCARRRRERNDGDPYAGAVRAARGQSAGVGRHRADVRTRQHPPRRGADDDEPTRRLRRPAPQGTRATTRQAAGRPRTPGIGTQTRRRRRGGTVHRDVHRRRRVTARREMCRGRRIRESVGSSIVESVRLDLRGVRGGGANGCGGRGDGTLRAMDAMGARHRRRGHRRRVATVARVHPRV